MSAIAADMGSFSGPGVYPVVHTPALASIMANIAAKNSSMSHSTACSAMVQGGGRLK